MKQTLGRTFLTAAALLSLAGAALAAGRPEHPAAAILWEYVGQVINGGAGGPSASAQFGNLVGSPCAAAERSLTFYTEATTTRTTSTGPLRIVDRVGTTSVYLPPAPGDFASPETFRTGTLVQTSRLEQQVILDTSTGSFTVLNVNTVSPGGTKAAGWTCPELLRPGVRIRTELRGHLNAPGSAPTGWFGGFAELAQD
ncbi:MAG TPA: hypothetical protein VMT11_03335 [Myxococcaceae bacterium]|nr:hypothetical protein [Myxococcaceae bacterium]